MNCPKCSTIESKGFVHGPNRIKTKQGYIFVIECVNCGWFLEKEDRAIVFEIKRIERNSIFHKNVSLDTRQYVYRILNKE